MCLFRNWCSFFVLKAPWAWKFWCKRFLISINIFLFWRSWCWNFWWMVAVDRIWEDSVSQRCIEKAGTWNAVHIKKTQCGKCLSEYIHCTSNILNSNCTGERSFSHLKRIKNALHSTMGQKRLSSLAILSIESELVRQIDFSTLIANFAELKSRRKPV